jgi:RNA polymerase sigma factor (sigma-70 family)
MPYNSREINQISKTIQKFLNERFSNLVKPCDRMDCSQDIVERIVRRNLQHDAAIGSMEAWLSRVVKNHLIDESRRKKKLVMVLKDNFDRSENLLDEDGSEYEELISEKMEQYENLLSEETEENQQIMRLYYEHNLSDNEIADLLGISVNALPMRRLRSRAKMKKRYKI